MVDGQVGTVAGSQTAKKGKFYQAIQWAGGQKTGILVFFLYLSLAVIAYWPVMNNSQVSDDFRDLVKTIHIPLTELWRIFTNRAPTFMRPVPYLEVWLLYKAFGMNWLATHLINVIMHAGSGFLLYLFLRRLKAGVSTALLTGTIFVLYPFATEAVTWTAARFDVRALFFILLSMYLYLVFIQQKSRLAFAGAMAAAAVAFLCKEPAMILVIIIPAIDILFGRALLPESGRAGSGEMRMISGWAQRFLILYAIFAGYIALRYAVLGGLGGYKSVPLFGRPNIKTPVINLLTFLSPLNRIAVSRSIIVVVGTYSGLLCMASLAVVALRWKKASIAAHRVWILFAVFSLSTCMLIYSFTFMEGTSHYLKNARLFYILLTGLITLMIVGLLEFTRGYKAWHALAIVAVLVLLPVYFWGVRQNNKVWEHAAAVSYYITEETYKELPSPPPDSILYYRHVPYLVGNLDFASALPEAISLKYGRDDLQVYYVEPAPELEGIFEDRGADPPDGYMFVFDRVDETLHLERGPLR